MNQEKITVAVKEFVHDDDKKELFTECYDAIEFMMKQGATFEDARYTVRSIVSAVRSCYGE